MLSHLHDAKLRKRILQNLKKSLNRVAYAAAGTEISAEVSLSCLPHYTAGYFWQKFMRKYYRAHTRILLVLLNWTWCIFPYTYVSRSMASRTKTTYYARIVKYGNSAFVKSFFTHSRKIYLWRKIRSIALPRRVELAFLFPAPKWLIQSISVSLFCKLPDNQLDAILGYRLQD